MSPVDMVDTGNILLVAGHETTVNLITNGMLTLLRHADVLQRLRRGPDLVIGLVEELLRYEPPVHTLPNRWALADIAIAGTTIPRGSHLILLLASGNRDPARFRHPERFDPDRQDNQHLGFGSGIHHAIGCDAGCPPRPARCARHPCSLPTTLRWPRGPRGSAATIGRGSPWPPRRDITGCSSAATLVTANSPFTAATHPPRSRSASWSTSPGIDGPSRRVF
jgi:hypothetical protein